MINEQFGRIAAYAIFLGASTSCGSIALSQTVPTVNAPAIRSPVDANGVNLATGGLEMSATNVSIGAAGSSGLAHVRYWTGNGWRHGFFATLTVSGTTTMVSIGDQSTTFTLSGGVYTSDQGNGSTLVAAGAGLQYTASDGTTVVFDKRSANAAASYYGTQVGGTGANAIGTIITLPSGEQITLSYLQQGFVFSGVGTVYVLRLQSVTSNSGYQLKYDYASNGTTSADLQNWMKMSKVTGINNAVDYCDPTANSCTFTQPWPTVSYATTTSGTNMLESVTDALNRVTRYTTNASNKLIGIKRPSSSTDTETIGYDASGRVASICNTSAASCTSATTWSYAWSLSGSTLTATVTDPLAHQRVTTADVNLVALLTDRNALGYTTTFTPDANGRLMQVTQPEGNYTQYTYDSRGNVTKTRNVSKTSGVPTDIITSSTYPSSCASLLTCNKPTATIDAKGNQTDYTYDSGTGLITSVTAPAPATGAVRPQTRYGYTPLHAYYKDSGGAISPAGISITKLTSVSSCATLATCAGGADETKTTIDYGPQVTGTANNLLPVTVTQGSGDGTTTPPATVITAYDIFGNIFTVTGPLGAAYTTRYRFDAGRQLVGVVGPDPDGAGSLKNRAMRMTYNPDGQVTITEQGTVNSQSDPDWSTFSRVTAALQNYDSLGLKTREILTDNTLAPYALRQYSYDAANRLDCAAVRMNPSYYSSLPTSACSATVAGTYGEDRITKYGYDAADQQTSLTTAYGTAQAQTTALTYSQNGKLKTLADGKNNLTTNYYDGFDRVFETDYPSKTTPGVSSSTDYAGFGYDAASNLQGQRLRDGTSVAYGHDNLNRLTSVTLPSGATNYNPSYTYDNFNRLTQVSDTSGHAYTFGYDALGRKVSDTTIFGSSKTMQYDLAGRQTRLTWAGSPSFYVSYDYDNVGEMTAIRENGATSGVGVLATFTYDDLGRRTLLTRGNGTSTSYHYDPTGRLDTHALLPAAVGTSIGLAYNPASQITSRTSSNDAYAFRQAYNANRSYATNGLNQYTNAGTAALGYDQRGNTSAIGTGSYAYNSLDQLTATPGASFYYDPLGRLGYQYTPHIWSDYDGDELITELGDTGTVQRRYVYGPSTDEPLVWYEGSGTSDRRFLGADERGSIVQVTDSSGNLIATNAYGDYGIPQSGNVGRFQYTGQAWLAEAQLYYYKARVYNPALGRFMQTDPIGYAAGINLYNYAGSDPINNRDSGGLEPEIVVNGYDNPFDFGFGFGFDFGAYDNPFYSVYDSFGFGYPATTTTDPTTGNITVTALHSCHFYGNCIGTQGVFFGSILSVGYSPPPTAFAGGAPTTQNVSRQDPCSPGQKAGQFVGVNVGKVGAGTTTVGLGLTAGGVAGLGVAAGQVTAGNFLGGLRTGFVSLAAIEFGADVTSVGGLITAGGATIASISGSGKAAVVEGLTRLSTERLPSGPLKDFASEALSRALDAVVPDVNSCRP